MESACVNRHKRFNMLESFHLLELVTHLCLDLRKACLYIKFPGTSSSVLLYTLSTHAMLSFVYSVLIFMYVQGFQCFKSMSLKP